MSWLFAEIQETTNNSTVVFDPNNVSPEPLEKDYCETMSAEDQVGQLLF